MPTGGARTVQCTVCSVSAVNHDFDVVFSPAFAVGNNGPSCIGRCVFGPGKTGQEEETEQAGGRGFDIGHGDGDAGEQAFVGDVWCIDHNG